MPALSDYGERKVKLSDLTIRPHRYNGEIFEFQGPIGVVLEDKHDLEQRRDAGIALRMKFLDQFLKRQILMVVGVQSRLAHPAEQFLEWRVIGKISAKHQRVDEEADQALDLLAGSAGDGRCQHDVLLATVAVEQGLKGRQQGHEQGDAFALA